MSSEASPTLDFGLGTHTLTLTVTDIGGASGTDTVVTTILAAGSPADTVVVLKATYSRGKKQLDVEATSSDAPDAILTVYDISNGSNTSLGALPYSSRKGRYAGGFKLPGAPAQVEVRSSNGGSDTSLVAVE